MYKIIEISENSKEKKDLVEYSGYCIIELITSKIEQSIKPISEDVIVDTAFVEYDYENRNSRQPNDYYINAANSFVSRNRKR